MMPLDSLEPNRGEVCGFLFAAGGNTLQINTKESNSHLDLHLIPLTSNNCYRSTVSLHIQLQVHLYSFIFKYIIFIGVFTKTFMYICQCNVNFIL